MTTLRTIKHALKARRGTQVFVSVFLSTILVLLSYNLLPHDFAVFLLYPGYLLTVRFFSAGVHAGTPLTVAIISANIILYAVAIYAALRFLGRHRPAH